MSQRPGATPNTQPAGIRKSTAYSPELDALRGWAILLVFAFHADGAVMGTGRAATTVSPVLAFMTAGHTGVTLFFVLSAILLARPFLEEGTTGRRVSRVDFSKRRALRIMPLYSVAVIVAVALSYKDFTTIIDGLKALTFYNSFTGPAAALMPYNAVWWSLATEIQFYLALPLLGIFVRNRLGRMIGVSVLLVWATAYVVMATSPSLGTVFQRLQLNLSLAGRAPAFLFGIAASWLLLHHGERLRAAARKKACLRNGGSDLILLISLLALGILLTRVSFRGFFRSEIVAPTWHFTESLLWTVIVLLIVLAPLRIRAVISNRATARLGVLSYSLYLIHLPVLYFVLGPLVARGVPVDTDLALRVMAFTAAFALCVTMSAITYHWIERPFLVLKAQIDR